MWRNKLSQMSKHPLPNAGIQKPHFNPELVAGGGPFQPNVNPSNYLDRPGLAKWGFKDLDPSTLPEYKSPGNLMFKGETPMKLREPVNSWGFKDLDPSTLPEYKSPGNLDLQQLLAQHGQANKGGPQKVFSDTGFNQGPSPMVDAYDNLYEMKQNPQMAQLKNRMAAKGGGGGMPGKGMLRGFQGRLGGAR
jgi:hypothetical protein